MITIYMILEALLWR